MRDSGTVRGTTPAPSAREWIAALVRGTLAAAALGAAVAGFRPIPAVAEGVPAPVDAAQANVLAATSFEQTIVDLVNNDRIANGLQPLDLDLSLLPTARERAAAQLTQPALNHFDADGRLAFVQDLARDGVTYSLAGENLARLTGQQTYEYATAAEDALMRSPTHRANILEPTYNGLAVGVTQDAYGRVVLAQIFRAA